MKLLRAVTLVGLLAGSLQAAADCSFTYEFTNAPGQYIDGLVTLNVPSSTGLIDNRSRVCTYWSFVYSSTGFSALTLTLQSSTDGATWSTFGGTTVSGSNPSTSTTVSTYTASGFYPYLRISLSGVSGVGSLKTTLNGWLSQSSAISVGTPTPCRLSFGGDNAGPLVDSDLGPQTKMCRVNAAATISEVAIGADAGVPSIQLRKRHCSGFSSGTCTGWTYTNILSGALAAVTGGFDSCAKSSTGQTCIDGTTSSGTITVSSTAVAAGDYIEPVSGTAGGTAKTVSVTVVLQ